MKKALIPALVALALAGLVVWQLTGMGRIRCKVCVTFEGQRQCATARADSEKEARREAQSSACSLVAHGVSDAFACPNTRPDLVECGRE